jgi:hypothetical protein
MHVRPPTGRRVPVRLDRSERLKAVEVLRTGSRARVLITSRRSTLSASSTVVITPSDRSGELLRMKVKFAGAFGLLVRRCGWVRVTDVAKCRRQEQLACRAALPLEGLDDARSGVAPAPTSVGRVACQSATSRR